MIINMGLAHELLDSTMDTQACKSNKQHLEGQPAASQGRDLNEFLTVVTRVPLDQLT